MPDYLADIALTPFMIDWACAYSTNLPPGEHLQAVNLTRRHGMADLLYLMIVLVFFAASLAYVTGCEKT